MYTSGSTGNPKGVAIPHRGVVRLVRNTNYVDLRPTDVVAQVANCCFDLATFEIWGALLNGARLVVIDRDVTLAAAELASEIRRRGITTLLLTTSLFNLMAREQPAAFSDVRYVLFAGEAADPHSVAAVLKKGAPQHLINAYGPTETTTFALYHEVKEVPDGSVSIPIGKPIANTTAFVLNEHLAPVPFGVIGELYIGGIGLAEGYLGNQELTAGRFVSNPFGEGRMYRTGDLARYRPDGDIEFLGRADQQLKIRGFRIEPGEIEAALARHPGVAQAAVIGREDRPGDKRLVGYVVGADGEGAEPAVLSSYLGRLFPEYMVPTAIVVLEALPLTPNGKLDRKALPAPELRASATAGRRAPGTVQEKILSSLFTEILGVQRIGLEDNFFALGGDSISSIQLVSRARKAGLRITARDIFQYQSVEALASVASNVETLPAAELDGVGTLPLTPIMRWLLEREGSIRHFSQSMLLRLPARLREEQLVGAVQVLLDHHDALRLRMVRASGSGDWSLEIPAPGTMVAAACVRRVDVSGLDELARLALMRAQAQEARTRLDPQVGVMLQAVWFDAGDDQLGQASLEHSSSGRRRSLLADPGV